MKLKKLTDKSVPVPLKDSGYVYIGKNGTGSLNLKNDEAKVISYALISEDYPELTADEIELVNILKRDSVPGAKVLVQYQVDPNTYSYTVPVNGGNTDVSKIKGFTFSKDPEATGNGSGVYPAPDEIISGNFNSYYVWSNFPSFGWDDEAVCERFQKPQYAIAYYGEEEIDWTTVWTGTAENKRRPLKIIFYNCEWKDISGRSNACTGSQSMESALFIDCNFNNLTGMDGFFMDFPCRKIYFSDNILNAENNKYGDFLFLASSLETLCNLTINMPNLYVNGAGENIFSNLEIAPKFSSCRCFPYKGCRNLTSIPEYDVSGMGGIAESDWFNWSGNLQFFGGLKNVSGGCIDFWCCKKLTKASLLNILNKLEPVVPNSSIYRNGVIVFNAGSYVKLTEEEIQIATDKGWTVEYINY